MRNRMSRGVIALSTVLALLVAAAPGARAETVHFPVRTCNMYVNSNGFGAYCGSGTAYTDVSSWRQLLGNRPFIPCKNFPVPPGVTLAPPPEGKEWVLRLTIVDYNLDTIAPPGGRRDGVEVVATSARSRSTWTSSGPGSTRAIRTLSCR
jgi:hypothetical protein